MANPAQQQPDVPMLLAQLEETNLLLTVARNRCAHLRRENTTLHQLVEELQRLDDQAEPHKGANDGPRA